MGASMPYSQERMMTNCTDGHECKYQLRQTFTYRRFVCSGCPNIISITDAEWILNEHAKLKAKLLAVECGDCWKTLLECECE